MNLQPTKKTAVEIAIENGWTCRSKYDSTRVMSHDNLALYRQKVIVFADQNWLVEIYKCEHCELVMEVVRGSAPAIDPAVDHAERCSGCDHLKWEHYHTVEGPDNKKVWVRLWCQHGMADVCKCKRYVAPKRSSVNSMPDPEVNDVQRLA